MRKKLIVIAALLCFGSSVLAEQISFDKGGSESIKPISFTQSTSDNYVKVTKPTSGMSSIVNIVSQDQLSKYTSATDKFIQCNITAAYKDYTAIIDADSNSDFTYLSLAHRFSNIGLFSLAKSSLDKIKEKTQWQKQTRDMTEIYFPKYVLSLDEEILLAQMYSDIHFNNLAFESIKTLLKNDKLLKKSDYANYILASAYYQTKEFPKAQNAINKALSINQDNTNYLKLKTQILCDTKQFQDALKIVNHLISKEHVVMGYSKSLEILKEYILARLYKDDLRSKYHLATYLMLNNDYTRAIKELNYNIAKKKTHYESLTLMGDVYYQNSDYTKALDFYNRSYKVNKKYPKTLVGLGNVDFYSANYKSALERYNEVLKKDKTNVDAIINVAMAHKMLSQEERSYELLKKVVELDNNSDKAYYVLSLIFEDRRVEFLNSVLAINPLNADAWLDLAFVSISKQDYQKAQVFLDNAKTIDSNSYKYYYYQGLLDKQNNDYERAMLNFKKASKINPNFAPVIKELSVETNI